MTKEQAIEILEKFKNDEMQRDKLERDDKCGGWKIGDIYKHLELNEAIQTVLNMLKEKDKEIDDEKRKNRKLSNQLLKLLKEQDNYNERIEHKNTLIAMKNRQIDLMAKAFKQDDIRTVEEIKEYFERQAEQC